MKKTIIAALILVFAFAGAASAAPSINGPTGMINTPSADTLREGQFSLGYYNLKDGGVGTFNTNLMKNLEVGVAGFRYDSQADKTLVNAKLVLMHETVLTPGIAVGMEDIGGMKDRSAYAVASKALPLGFRLHAGVGNGRFNGTFAALEKTINPISILTGNNAFPATTLIAEYDGKNMNYGARMSILPGLKVDAGWRSSAFYIGASFTN